MTTDVAVHQAWPRLRVDDWTDTRDTLHMWSQIVGKIRLSQAPLLNHWWQVTLYVSPRVLTTGAIPHRGPGAGDEGAFYAYPEPDGFADYPVGPDGAYCSTDHRQFLLPYEAVAGAKNPERDLQNFLHSTYHAAADLADWDRTSLEDNPSRWPQHRRQPRR